MTAGFAEANSDNYSRYFESGKVTDSAALSSRRRLILYQARSCWPIMPGVGLCQPSRKVVIEF